jgi:hypothetical protein
MQADHATGSRELEALEEPEPFALFVRVDLRHLRARGVAAGRGEQGQSDAARDSSARSAARLS